MPWLELCAARKYCSGGNAARKREAALIKQVYEIDPLICPQCGGEIKIINSIEREQKEVIEKILKHGGLWEEETARAPPEEKLAGPGDSSR